MLLIKEFEFDWPIFYPNIMENARLCMDILISWLLNLMGCQIRRE